MPSHNVCSQRDYPCFQEGLFRDILAEILKGLLGIRDQTISTRLFNLSKQHPDFRPAWHTKGFHDVIAGEQRTLRMDRKNGHEIFPECFDAYREGILLFS